MQWFWGGTWSSYVDVGYAGGSESNHEIGDFDDEQVGEGGGVGQLAIERDAAQSELSRQCGADVADARPSLPTVGEHTRVHVLHRLERHQQVACESSSFPMWRNSSTHKYVRTVRT